MPRTIVTEIQVNCSVNGAASINSLATSLQTIARSGSARSIEKVLTAIQKIGDASKHVAAAKTNIDSFNSSVRSARAVALNTAVAVGVLAKNFRDLKASSGGLSFGNIGRGGAGNLGSIKKFIDGFDNLNKMSFHGFTRMGAILDQFSVKAERAARALNSIRSDAQAMGMRRMSQVTKALSSGLDGVGKSSGRASSLMTVLANAFMFLGSRSQFSLSQMGPMLFHMNKLGVMGNALIPIFIGLRAVMGVFRMIGNAVGWMGRQMVVGAKEVIAFKKELTTITAVANIPKIEFIKDENKTISTIDKIGASVRAMATATGIASEDIVSSMQEVARAGIAEKLAGGGTKTDAISEMTNTLAVFQKGVGASAMEAQSIVIGTATMWQGVGESQIDTMQELVEATDTWSLALNQTFLDADKLQTALQYSGNTFALLGTDVASTAAILGQFSQTGMKASKIGTASRAFGMALTNPKQLDMLRQYGIELDGVMTDAKGKMLPDAPIRALEAIKASGILDKKGGIGALNEIFGKVSGSSIAYIVSAVEQVRALQELDSKGYGKFLLAQQLESAGAQADRAREAFKNLRAEAGSLFEAPIRSISEGIANATQPVIDAFKKSMEERPQDVFKALDAGWKAFEAKGGGIIIAAFQTARIILAHGIMLAFSTSIEKLINGIIGAIGVLATIFPRMTAFLLEKAGFKGTAANVTKGTKEFDKFIFGSMKESVSKLFAGDQENRRTIISNSLGSMINLGGSQKERDTRFENNYKAEIGAANFEEMRSLLAKSKGEGQSPEEKMKLAEYAAAARMVGEEMGMSVDEVGSAMEGMVDATEGAATSLEKFNYATTVAEAAQASAQKKQELMADSANAATMALAEIVNSGISTSFKNMKSLMDEITGKSSLQNTPIPEEFAGSYKRSKSYISNLGRSGQISAAEAEKSMQQLEKSFGQTPEEGEKRSRRKKLQTEINKLLDDLEESTDEQIKNGIQDKVDAAREQMSGLSEGNESFSFKEVKNRFSKEGMRGLGGYLGETESSIGKYLNQEAIGDVVNKDADMQKQISQAGQDVFDKEIKRVEEANKKKQQEVLKAGFEGTAGGLEAIPQFDTLLSSTENVSTGFEDLGASTSELTDMFKNMNNAAKVGSAVRSMGPGGMSVTPEVQQMAEKMAASSTEAVAQVATPSLPSGQGTYASGGRVSDVARMIDAGKSPTASNLIPTFAGAPVSKDPTKLIPRFGNTPSSLIDVEKMKSEKKKIQEVEEKISNVLTDAQNKTLERLNGQVSQEYNELQRLSKEAKTVGYATRINFSKTTMPRRLKEIDSKRKAIFDLEKDMRSKQENEWDKSVSGAFGMPLGQEAGVDWSKLGGDPTSNLMGEVFGSTEKATDASGKIGSSSVAPKPRSDPFESLKNKYSGFADLSVGSYGEKNLKMYEESKERQRLQSLAGGDSLDDVQRSKFQSSAPRIGGKEKMAESMGWGKGSNVTINHGVISNYNVKDRAEQQAEPWAVDSIGI